MPEPQRPAAAERILCAYFAVLPLLWASGLTLPVALLMVGGLFGRSVRSPRALGYAWPWFLVGLAQLLAVSVNLAATGQPAWRLLRHLFASYVMGWFVLGAALTIGASGTVPPAPLLRSVMRIGFYCVSLAAVLYPLALIRGGRFMHVLTPVGQLLPVSLPSTSFFFGMLLYNWEQLFGVLLPRLSLFFPWTTAMGFGGLCLIFVVANEGDRRRRRWAVASGVFMVFASMSRLAILNLMLCAAARWMLEWPRRLQVALGSLAVAALLALAMISTLGFGSPTALVGEMSGAFDQIRPSATHSRDLVYEASWDGFYAAPLFGHGWPGKAVYPDDFPQVMQGGGTMVPGSHSTFIGLLYLGGVVTFAAFAFAFVRTLWLVARAAGPPALVRNTLVLLLAVIVTGIGEGLYSMVVPTLYAFVWLGVALRECHGLVSQRHAAPARAFAVGGSAPFFGVVT